MPSPIPGGDSFQEYRDDTDAPGRADIGNVDQRWDWISNSMLPSFRELEQDRPEEMMGYMERFHDNAGSSTPGPPCRRAASRTRSRSPRSRPRRAAASR
jgi:hypothetical protein